MGKKLVKPRTLSGFLELLPSDQILFNEMMDTIRKNFEKYGFLPLDTPVIEREEILLAKGGGETEKQIYRFKKGDTDLALRFDLTVPLARYVAQHFSDLTFPFRRYQIGKVYRGERSQKGRFREFYQCDIDIIGNQKLEVINDAEIPSIIYSTFKDLGFDDFTIKINNRKVLSGFFQWLGIEDTAQVLRSVDKLEKVGSEGVKDELKEIGLDINIIEKIMEFIKIDGSNEDILGKLKEMAVDNEIFNLGLEELSLVNEYVKIFGVPEDNYEIDLTIARGLDYYTGTVYETFLDNYTSLGSVCSGGRYDDLAGHYTNQKLPGVGISIGLTRLFYQLREANIISSKHDTLTKALIIPMVDCLEESIEVANYLREKGIITQVYFEKGKMGKKFSFADKLRIPYVLIIGPDEVEKEKVSLRNMETGDQELLSLEEVFNKLK